MMFNCTPTFRHSPIPLTENIPCHMFFCRTRALPITTLTNDSNGRTDSYWFTAFATEPVSPWWSSRWQRIRRAKGIKCPVAPPIIIVGNKRDLRHRRTVSSEEGRLLALAADCGFFEISAAENYHGVLLAFHGLLDLIRETRAPKKGAAGIKGIVRSVSAVFGRKRNDAKDTQD